MMKKYRVTITEYLEKTFDVDAETPEDAELKIETAYWAGDIVLYSDDYTETEFGVEELQPESKKVVKNLTDFSR